MSERRIKNWIFALLAVWCLVTVDGCIQEAIKGPTPIYVYAPNDMEKAFKEALDDADMKSDYEIVMADEKEGANIIVENGKEMDPEYTKIAFSPFVVAYAEEGKNLSKLEKNGLLSESFFNYQYYEINVLKIVEEVIGEGRWANFGLHDIGDLKVYYPDKDTPYWTDFYDFMLLTINGGTYPKTEAELRTAVEVMEFFQKSENTEAVKDFRGKIITNGGFLENAFYILPEKALYDAMQNMTVYARVFYPLTTVYFNYYIKADELGSRITTYFDDEGSFWEETNFYDCLNKKIYRSSQNPEFNGISAHIYDERNVFNVVELDIGRLRQLSMSASR